MKGRIDPDHIPVNRYQLLVLGVFDLRPTEISGLEDELDTNEMPDRTVTSGGNRKASEFSIMIPTHHTLEQAAMEIWYRESQDPVVPTYKKTATLIMSSISGGINRTYSLTGMFPKKRTLPDLEQANEGEMATTEWLLSVDDILPI